MSLQKDPENKESKILHKFVDFANKTILEIGCGEARLTWKYAKHAKQVFAFDYDHDALRIAQADCPEDLHKQVHFVNAEAAVIPFAKEKFDIAVLAWSL
jgi:ubiquinone/menaquinone biosynthesis C-methylase UbiE